MTLALSVHFLQHDLILGAYTVIISSFCWLAFASALPRRLLLLFWARLSDPESEGLRILFYSPRVALRGLVSSLVPLRTSGRDGQISPIIVSRLEVPIGLYTPSKPPEAEQLLSAQFS
jgi:hypothetical protein